MSETEFLNKLEKKLWTAADKLRSNLDAAEYKHVVLGLIFLKYVSDAFEEHRRELQEHFRDPKHDYYLEDETLMAEELEMRDYYLEKNIFWVPELARWSTLKNNAKLSNGDEITVKNGKTFTYTFRSVGKLIDDALEAIEKENPVLKGVLDKRYTTLQLEQSKLGELIDLFSDANFNAKDYKGKPLNLRSKDILGHVYEYFLGEFALAEGKKGGQYFTPKAIVGLIVAMLEPYKGRVYDPAMGSGGFFVQSERFIEEHGGRVGSISVYGQESNPTTWRLAAMNMAIRGMDFNFGKEPGNSFSNDKHPDLRADFVMANPPFNMKEWNVGVKDDDVRWKYGMPPVNNANYAWMQHMIHHLAPTGSMGLLLANGSMSSNTSNEGTIRKNLLENDLVECIVALPGQLFTNTQIPACIWFLTKSKKSPRHSRESKNPVLRDRRGEVLFIDARNLGYMKDRVLRDFTETDIEKIAGTFHQWQKGKDYQNEVGFCKSATLDEIKKHDYILTPGRYVGTVEAKDDGEPFSEKMTRLTGQLKDQFKESDKLEKQIKKNLKGLGYGI